MRRQLPIFLIFIHLLAFGQQGYSDFGRDFKLRINSNGILGIDINSLQPVAGELSTDKHFLAQAGIWVSARDASNGLHTSVQMLVKPGQFDFFYGPLDTILTQPDTSGWNKVWMMDAQTVEEHRKNYTTSGYTVPENIGNWPGSQNGSNFVEYLAPFADVNNNQLYDPENGDFPYIHGDEAVYVICNDNVSEHKVSYGSPLGLEVHIMAYRYKDIPNTWFFEYYLINRMDEDYYDLRLGLFLSAECGNNQDNFAGTVKDHNTIYAFNGDALDEGGFEDNLPFVYARFLNKEIEGSVVFINDTGAVNGLPDEALEFDHYLHSRWTNGQAIQFGGNGIDPATDYPYMFVGDSDPSKDTWSEVSEGNIPGFRNILGILRYSELKQNSYIRMNYCLGFGFYSNNADPAGIVNNSSISAAERYFSTSEINNLSLSNVNIYPNPATTSIWLEAVEYGWYKIEISNIQGITVFKDELLIEGKTKCNISLPQGVYILELNRNGRILNKKLCIQP